MTRAVNLDDPAMAIVVGSDLARSFHVSLRERRLLRVKPVVCDSKHQTLSATAHASQDFLHRAIRGYLHSFTPGFRGAVLKTQVHRSIAWILVSCGSHAQPRRTSRSWVTKRRNGSGHLDCLRGRTPTQ